MTRYLISFDDGAMVIPEHELPAVGEAAHAVVRAAQEAGVWIFGGGVVSQRASIVATDGTITDGPYRIVRHPMYASASLYLLGTSLALGSYWGFVPIAAMTPFLIWRLFDEERFLARDLPGYTEYQRRVRHRLVPFVW